jgi:chitodextrinase
MFRRQSALVPGLLLLVLGLLGPASVRGVTYPKKALYSFHLSVDPEVWEEVARYDLVVTTWETPEAIAAWRSQNPDIKILFRWSPQVALPNSEDETFWYPDTTWSLLRLVQFYALQNDWFLRDTDGNRIQAWGQWMLNWTRYCPKGTYGTSRGLTYAEWLARVAIPQIVLNSPDWEPWGWGSTAYDGIHFEVLVDCMGSFYIAGLENADPDRDGLPEGVSQTCTQGGDQDSLSILFREVNEAFFQDFQAVVGDEIPYVMNMNNPYMGPSWRETAWGVKVERWLDENRAFQDWWDWFYGLRNWNGQELWGPGYKYAEDHYRPQGPDDRTGWDLSLLELFVRPEWSASKRERMARFGLGTALLGDGYFVYTEDEATVLWRPEFDWDLGQPLGDYAAELVLGPAMQIDTLYVRNFQEGVVLVNPQDHEVGEVPAEDAVIAFWQRPDDFRVQDVGETTATLAWTIPAAPGPGADGFEIRYATAPIDAESWKTATPAPGSPFQGGGGDPMAVALTGLQRETTYYAALRSVVRDHLDPQIVQVGFTTLGDQDDVPPARIEDLVATAQGQDWVAIQWTAPGDDGTQGQASQYRIRYLPGRAIETEMDWNIAHEAADGIPTPGPPGTQEAYVLTGLEPGTAYGIAVRAYDEVPNEGPLSNPLLVTTQEPPPPPDTEPPGGIDDLHAADSTQTAVLLVWTAPGDDGDTGQATRYELAYQENDPILTEEDWDAATRLTSGLPDPAPAGTLQEFWLPGLQPGHAYGVALRAVDEAEQRGPLSAPLVVHTLEPPDTLAPEPVGDLAVSARGETWLELVWTAPRDLPDSAAVASYVVGYRPGQAILTEEDWAGSTLLEEGLPTPAPPGTPQTFRLEGLEPATAYGLCLRSRDAGGLLSGLSPALVETTLTPAPPPDTLAPEAVGDLRLLASGPTWARLAWTAPADSGGSGLAAYEIRWMASSEPIGEDTWAQAQPVADPPTPGSPGATDSLRLDGLAPETSYAMALRTRDGAGNVSAVSNPLVFVTPAPADTLAPAAVTDLAAQAVGPTWVTLACTMPGDDGMEGTAETLLVRLRSGSEPILEEADWDAASPAEAPAVAAPGQEVVWTLAELKPETDYAVAVRARDEAGHLAPLSNPLVVRTPAWPDTAAPEAIDDLRIASVETTRVLLAWTVPEDPGGELSHYILATLVGETFSGQQDWERAAKDSTGLPTPGVPGATDSVWVEGLEPGISYAWTLRVRDTAGHLSPLGNFVVGETSGVPDSLPGEGPGDDKPPEEPPPPPPVPNLTAAETGPGWVALRWEAPQDTAGVVAGYVLGYLEGDSLETEEDWSRATTVVEGLPGPAPGGTPQEFQLGGLDPGGAYGILVRARDAGGRLSAMRPGIWVVLPEPLFPRAPAPVTDLEVVEATETEALLRWTAPADSGSPVVAYALRVTQGELVPEWWDSLPAVPGAPTPLPPGSPQSWRLTDLDPGTTYRAALRSQAANGLWSPLSNVVVFVTRVPDAAPPLPPSGLQLTWVDEATIRLRWEPVGDPDLVGYHVYARPRGKGFGRLTADPVPVPEWTGPAPPPEAPTELAVSAVDRWGLESALSPLVPLYAENVHIEGPFPHPFRKSTRLRLRLPPRPGGRVSVRAEVVAVTGRRVARLWDGPAPAGRVLELAWDGSREGGGRSAAGIYVLRIEVDGLLLRRRLLMIR